MSAFKKVARHKKEQDKHHGGDEPNHEYIPTKQELEE